MKNLKKKNIIVYAVMAVIFILMVFINNINLNPLYPQSAFFYLFIISAYTIVWIILKLGSFSLGKLLQGGKEEIDFSSLKPNKKSIKRVVITVVCLWVVYFGVQIYSTPLFHSKDYRDQLGTPEDKVFSSDMQTVDIDKIPVVDKEFAKKLAEQKLGEKQSLGSQVILGEPVVQQVDGDLVWVVPLQHSGFFKWLSNMDGTPGYIKVSATNFRNVEYIDTYKIKYQPSAYIFDNLDRHVRFGGGLFTGYTDMSFELDDSGKPYWVVTTYKNTCGFALPEATGILLVDASSGAIERYSVENVPAWVDRVQPESFIIEQIKNRGEYVHGVFNFSNQDKFMPSDGDIIIYNNNRCYLFTGVTSVGSDDSAMGFMMVDMVTKEPHYYRMGGATEQVAQKSAQQKISHLNYRASFPIALNINATPTYFMTLKDNEGLIKQYAFVSIKEYAIVGVAENIDQALLNYQRALSSSGSASLNGETEPAQQISFTGTVERIASEITDGSTVYKILLAEKPDIIFTADASISNELALTQKGDSITLTYTESPGPIIQTLNFDNLAFGPAGNTATENSSSLS